MARRPAPIVSLALRCGDAFDADARRRGEDHWRRGRLRDVQNGAGVQALVLGTGRARHRVSATSPEPGVSLVRLECGCAQAVRLEPCAHMWALVLEIDARGLGGAFPSDPVLDLIVSDGRHEELLPAGTPEVGGSALADDFGGDEDGDEGEDEDEDEDEGEGEGEDEDEGEGEDEDEHEHEDEHEEGDEHEHEHEHEEAGGAVGDDGDDGDALDRIVAASLRAPLPAVTQAALDRPARRDPAARDWDQSLAFVSAWPSAAAAARPDGLLPRPSSVVPELHVRRRRASSAELAVALVWRAVRRDGTPGAYQVAPPRISYESMTPEEARLVRSLIPEQAHSRHAPEALLRVPRAAVPVLVPELCAWGRFGWVAAPDDTARSGAVLHPLGWDGDVPYAAHLSVEADPVAGGVHVCMRLERGEESVSVEGAVQIADGLVVLRDRIIRTEAAALPWLLAFGAAVKVHAREVDGFFAALAAAPALPPVRIDASLGVSVVTGVPVPRLSVDGAAGRGRHDLSCTLELRYDEVSVPLDRASSAVWHPGTRALVLRDLVAEAELFRFLGGLGFCDNDGSGAVTIAQGRFDAAAQTLLDRDWDLRATSVPVRRGRSVSLAVSSVEDWFELSGEVDFGETTASLPELLRAIEEGRRWVTLDDGSRGLMPVEWLERYGLIDRGKVRGDRVRFARAQGPLLAMALRSVEVATDRGFRRLRRQLRSFDRVQPQDAPPSFVAELRPYQRLGLGWLLFLQQLGFGGCLADDMGLGKTIQVLALLDGRRSEPRASLVVAPRSLLFNWAAEAARFAPELRVATYHGPARHALLGELDSHDLVLTTYGTVRRDGAALARHRFDYVVLDEAQAIKNPYSKVAHACLHLDAAHHLALTGTPIENSLGDLASILEFLNNGMVGNLEALQALSTRRDPTTAERSMLATALRPFLLRRTKAQVLPELPDKTEQTIHCVLGGAERRAYEELRQHYRVSLAQRIADEGLASSKIYVLEALLRLRQAACHPGLLDPARAGEGSAKIDTLVDQLREVVGAGHKALVFSQFTTLLGILRPKLDELGMRYAYLDGSTRDRASVVERFQTDADCPVFLLSLKAGGTGLNLTAAGYVFLLDPWWNPAVEAQAIDRTHRIGQTRPVMAYRLVAQDTVEDKILALQQRKRSLAEEILTADKRGLAALEAGDLEVLLG